MPRTWVFVIAVVLVGLGAVSPAMAGGWPFSHAGEVLLEFGAPYGEASRAHSGLDIEAPAGSEVRTPFDAVVSFVGSVPVSAGGTSICVSLDLGDGRTMTLLPLSDSGVQTGQSVSAGDAVGILAAHGDASSDRPHLHVGLRRGSVYLDPAGVLIPPPAPAPDSPVTPDPAPAPPVAHPAAPARAQPASSPAPVATTTAVSAGSPEVGPITALDPGPVPVADRPHVTWSEATGAWAVDVAGARTSPKDAGVRAAAPPAVRSGSHWQSVAADGRRTARGTDARGAAAVREAGQIGRTPAMIALLLAAAVLLWPLWSTYARPGLSEGVIPVGDDIAAAVDR